ncbi:MAG: restriction endonuclease subunit S [Chloroflexota bacterium]
MTEGEVQLGEVADLVRGVNFRPSELATESTGAVPLLRATNIGDHTLDLANVIYVPTRLVREAQHLRRFDVVIAMSSGSRKAVGRLAPLRQTWDGCVGAFCAAIRPKPDRIDPAYLGYVLQSADFRERIEAYAVGTAIMNLSKERLLGFRFGLPPDRVQRRIAHILGTLDDKIELNRRMSEALEAIARALFKSWFVDFDPVRAKSEGRDPGLPPHLADLFPGSFEDSELGEIPTGWRLAPLPAVVKVNPPRSLRKGVVAPYLDMANMPTRGHSPDAVVDRPFGSGMRFQNGDTLVARITPCLENGKTAYVDFLEPGQVGWGSTEYIVLRAEPPLPTEYAYCLARSDEFREFAIQSMTGSSGRQRVPAESLSYFLAVSPSSEVARLFGTVVHRLLEQASMMTAQSRTLAALRDALLPDLISGVLHISRSQEERSVRTLGSRRESHGVG